MLGSQNRPSRVVGRRRGRLQRMWRADACRHSKSVLRARCLRQTPPANFGRLLTFVHARAAVIVPGMGPGTPYRATGRAPYALISDIHGNARALDAVLAELERFGIDDGIVLGDVAQ